VSAAILVDRVPSNKLQNISNHGLVYVKLSPASTTVHSRFLRYPSNLITSKISVYGSWIPTEAL